MCDLLLSQFVFFCSFYPSLWFRSFVPSFRSFVRTFRSFVRSFVPFVPFVRLFRSFRSFVPFVRSFPSFVRSVPFVLSVPFVRSFVRSFRSFVPFLSFRSPPFPPVPLLRLLHLHLSLRLADIISSRHKRYLFIPRHRNRLLNLAYSRLPPHLSPRSLSQHHNHGPNLHSINSIDIMGREIVRIDYFINKSRYIEDI
jgi:hypothetical protein